MIVAVATSLLIASSALSADPVRHSVTFTATATGVEASTPVEFVFARKDSDHDYESLYLVDASPKDFLAAFREAKIPLGNPIDPSSCRLWPTGPRLTLEPALTNLVISSVDGKAVPFEPIVLTGGTRDAKGMPVAETNMPGSVFSTYDLAQSLMLFDGIFPQGEVYGRYRPVAKTEKGARKTFTLTWDGHSADHAVTAAFKPGNLSDELKRLKGESEKGCLDVLATFDPELTVAESVRIATALSTVDSPRVKVNGKDKVFYRAFLPREQWLTRSERLTQPVEVHFLGGGTNKVVEVREDWSGDAVDPKLIVLPRLCNSWKETAAAVASIDCPSDTLFAYLRADSKLAEIYRLLSSLVREPAALYVFTEDAP